MLSIADQEIIAKTAIIPIKIESIPENFSSDKNSSTPH